MRKNFFFLAAALVCVVASIVAGCGIDRQRNASLSRDTVKIGLLHSHTGVMALSEMPVRDAEKLAVEEINARGGILGRQIEIIERDGASDDKVFAAEAQKLLNDDGVVAVFGCWTSSSRKAVKPLLANYGALLWYPLQYEGLEKSEDIVYLGQVPNQQVLPAVEYLVEQGKYRMYLLGSDYVFPHTVNDIIERQLIAVGGTIVGDEYVPMNCGGFADTIERIKAARPDVVINTLNGSSNAAFFAAFRHAGLTAEQLPVMSFSISETEIANIGASNAAGHLVCQGYCQTVSGERNEAFVAAYKKAYGSGRFVGDAIETGYNAVYMWKAAVEKADGFEKERVKAALKDLEILTPEGILTMDRETMHAYRRARVGRIDESGLIKQIIVSDVIKPDPFLVRSPWTTEVKSE